MLLENNPFPQDGRVRREADALVAAGYRVSVICPRANKQCWRETVNGVSAYRFPAPPEANGLLGYLWEYGYSLVMTFVISLYVFFQKGFDVIHAHNPPDLFVLVGAFYKLFGKRFIFDHHDLSPEMYYARFAGQGNRFTYQALVSFEKLSFRLADHIISTNQSYKVVAMERGGVPENRISIVRNGPDLSRLQLAPPDPELRRKGKTIIGYVGVMGFQDGVDYLLRALHHLVFTLDRTDFYCVIIGKGDAWTDLKVLATQLGLDEYIWFTGRVSDAHLISYLSTADICVDPDPSNPFNDRSTMIKMTEYMALGKPIVAFDLPEHRFTAQKAALYVRPNDELEFARALIHLMDDPIRRQAMGAYGRHRIENELAWQYSVPQLLKVYRSLLPDSFRQRLPTYDY
jgi:glycosyltransferase involved in cell wall biosynthesis